jgi:N-acetylmuramoyl-L-alanine amidase
MKIIDHLLYHDDDTPYPYRSSPNRSGTFDPKFLIMHYTAGSSAKASINWLINPRAKASAHIVIGRDGGITQLIPFNVVAWHAGASTWQGYNGLNKYSIGIELDNAGTLVRAGSQWRSWFGSTYPDEEVIEAIHKNETVARGWHLYTAEQLYVALDLASLLVEQYHLQDVLGHDDIAPRVKTDPGPAFPMDTFRARLFGRQENEQDTRNYVTTTMLNIRRGPSAEYALLPQAPLSTGTRLEATGNESGAWKEVNVLDVGGNVQGWVHGRYIKLVS